MASSRHRCRPHDRCSHQPSSVSMALYLSAASSRITLDFPVPDIPGSRTRFTVVSIRSAADRSAAYRPRPDPRNLPTGSWCHPDHPGQCFDWSSPNPLDAPIGQILAHGREPAEVTERDWMAGPADSQRSVALAAGADRRAVGQTRICVASAVYRPAIG